MRKVPQARRSTFTPALGKQVLQRIAEGESLSKVCGPDREAGMPARLTVYNWLARYPHFRRAYLLARMAQSELYADEVIEIADICDDSEDSLNRWRRDRIRMEARRWRVGRLSPEVYVKGLNVVGREAEEAVDEEFEEEAYGRFKRERVATQLEALLEGDVEAVRPLALEQDSARGLALLTAQPSAEAGHGPDGGYDD